MFIFNASKYDFWPVYETIKMYYPIGIYKKDNHLYESYKGQTELKKLIEENFHNIENYDSRWKQFVSIIENGTGMKTMSTTNGMAPSFSSLVEIERIENDKLVRIKRIHFIVSLLGPFYTIFGDDISEITVGGEKKYVTNYLVASPFNEFAEVFEKLTGEIENKFTHYRFVPLFISKQSIEGLDVGYTEENSSLIFNTLFNRDTNLNTWTYGDKYYKMDGWLL